MTFDSRSAIAVYRGWHALEESLPAESRASVIDFDLVPDIADRERFSSRDAVTARIEQLRAAVDQDDEVGEFIHAKLTASMTYLRCLAGERLEFYEHVRRMLGKTPELVSDQQVAEQREVVLSLLREFGVRLVGGGPDPASFSTFDDSIRLDQDAALKESAKAANRFIPAIQQLLGFGDLRIPYRTEPDVADAYWIAWASGGRDDLLLRLNFHESNHWRRGDLEFLMLHEVCGHFLHATLVARRIQAGELDPFLGITTIHDPQAFIDEGSADALSYFFEDDVPLSPYGVLAREQRLLRDYLNNNAPILINMGAPHDELLATMLTNPYTVEAYARRNLATWPGHPVLRAYQYAYGIGQKYHRRWAARMSRDQRIRYLRYALSTYVTPNRLIAAADEIARS
jgi:hypothetical protein